MPIQAQLIPNPILQFFDSNGIPLAGGKLFSYAAGTTTPQPTFTDATGSVQNPNPLILDSEGKCEVWMNNSGYKFTLQDYLGVPQWTVDQVFLVPPGFIGTTQIADGSVTSVKIASQAIITALIADGAVTTAKIANGAVTAAKIPNGTITIALLDPNLDVSGLNKNIEILYEDKIEPGWKSTPQFPWAAPTLLSNPATLPPGAGGGVAWSPNGEFLAVASTTTPFITIYQRFGTSFFKMDNPATLPAGNATSCAWSPDGQFLAVGHITTPFVTIYQKFGATFTKLANPASLPAGTTVEGVAWSRDGLYLSVSTVNTALTSAFAVYQRGGAAGVTFTRLTNPAGQTAPSSVRTAFTSDGQYIAFAQVATQGVAYQIQPQGGGTFGAPLSIPALPAGGSSFAVAWSPNRQFYAIAYQAAPGNPPYIALYQFANGVFTSIPAPLVVPNQSAQAVDFSPNSKYLALGSTDSGTNKLIIYSIAGTTFTALTAPTVPPGSNVTDVKWSPDGQFIAVSVTGSPFVLIYQTSSLTFQSDSVPWVRGFTSD